MLRRQLPLLLIAGLLLAGRVAAASGGAAVEAPLTLEQAAGLALRQGPAREDLELSAARATAGADLAESAFRWHVGLGTAKIPQLAELAAQFGGALGDVKVQLQNHVASNNQPVQPTIVSPGLTGIVYDPASGHRWAVLPAITAARTLPNGGQLILTTHWAGFGPLSDDSATKSYTGKWQPFDRLPLVQYTQPLFRDPSTLEAVARKDEAGRNLERDRVSAVLTETKTLLDLAQAYFAVAQAEDEVAVAGRALAQAQTEARVRQDKAWKDEATGLDLLEADLLTQKAAARVEAGRRALDLARQRLNRLLGRPLTAPVSLAPPVVSPGEPIAAPDLAAAVREALARRPEVALAKTGIESAQGQLKMAREATRAQVEARAGVNKDKSWAVGLEVQWPLWDGGTGKAQVAQSSAALAQAEKARADREADLTLQVTQAHYARQDAARAFAVADLAVRRAQEALARTREWLTKGAAVDREVLAAEDALFEAEASRRAALYRSYLAEWGWLAALGRLPETVQS